MILVLGATGTIGRPLCKRLAERRAAFRALVRTAEKGEALGHPYLVGDLDDPQSLTAAFAGVRRVFLNSSPGPALARQQRAAIEAAKAAGVSQLVKLSTRGVTRDAKVMAARLHAEIEEEVAGSGLGWSVLRPGFFMQNFLRHADTIRSQDKFYGAYRDGRISFLDVQDIATAAAVLLTSEGAAHQGHLGQAFELTGGEALTHAEVAQQLTEQLGRPIAYVDLPVEQIIAHMVSSGMPEEFARGLGTMMTGMAAGGAAAISDGFTRLTGQPPRTFRQFLEANVSAFR